MTPEQAPQAAKLYTSAQPRMQTTQTGGDPRRHYSRLETTMETDDLDAALIRLRDSLGDLAMLNDIIISIRRNADRLLDPLTSVLQETRNAIEHTLAVLETRP